MSLEATEQECAADAKAPRVALADIESSIAEAHYFTGADAVGRGGLQSAIMGGPLSLLTICLVVMKNGFTVIGKSAPASPKNFNAELGAKLAYEDAVRQIWPLMGFALRDRLHASANSGSAAATA